MLVLSRKAGESIIINGNITVTITSIERNKVRIGFSAPPDISIDREEIHQAKQQFVDVEVGELVAAH